MFYVLISALCVGYVWGHAALYEPPSRSSMWRFGFKTPRNYNDMELYCGGMAKLWEINDGKCGICGDDWSDKEPRANEDGGKYGTGRIVRTYRSGMQIKAKINVVANQLGHFEFKLCPVQKGVTSDQACFDKHPIPLADGSGYRYDLGSQKGIVVVMLRLPEGLSCERCIFQWHWKCANNWGFCEKGNGDGALGCGPQEYYRSCADVKIV